MRQVAAAAGGPVIDGTLGLRVSGEYQRRNSEMSYPLFADFAQVGRLEVEEFYNVRGTALARLGDTATLRVTFSHAYDSPILDDAGGPGFGLQYSERRGDFNSPFFQEVRRTRNNSATAELTIGAGKPLTLTALTTYAHTKLDIPSVNARTPGEIFVADGRQTESLFTQDIHLNFGDSQDKLSGVIGVFYAKDESNRDFSRTVPFGGGRTDTTVTTRSDDNFAAYGEVTWRATNFVRFIAGGRVDHQRQIVTNDFLREFFNPALSEVIIAGASRGNETVLLPKAAVLFDLAEKIVLGISAQRGFRAGGAGTNQVTGQPFVFDSEFAWTYETSLKAQTLDGALQIGVNVFYTDWKDQQVSLRQDPLDFSSSITVNAAASRLFGGELEVQARPTKNLDLFGSLGILDTKFKQFATDLGDFSGLPFPESPDVTLAMGMEWRPRKGFFAGIDGKLFSRFFARDYQNPPLDRVGGQFVANARIGYGVDNWSLTVFADNLFNEQYFLYRDVIGDFDCCGTLGRSRQIGATVQTRF